MQRFSKLLPILKGVFGILVAVVFFSLPHSAHALFGISMESVTAGIVETLGGGLAYLVGWIASILFNLGGVLIDFALLLNQQLLESPIVEVGWNIVLNIANLGFVLAIIVIAFATIFRFPGYQMKQILWKLVVAALLVNFSLVIAGIFISIADIFVEFLKDSAALSGSSASFGDVFASIFKVQALLDTSALNSNPDLVGQLGTLAGSGLNFIASLLFIGFFTFLGALALLATAVMLFVRYVALGILLVLSPLAWLAWIFPGTASNWKKWWTKFFEWTFFAPIVMFFLYLAVAIIQNYDTYFDDTINSVGSSDTLGITIHLSVIGNLIIVLGFVIGGLIVSKSLSYSGGQAIYGFAERKSKDFGSWAGRKGRALGTLPLRSKPGQKAAEELQKWGSGSKYAAVRGLAGATTGRLGNVMQGFGSRQGEQLVKDAGERVKGFSSKALAARFNTLGRDEKIAAVERLVKEKKLNELSGSQVHSMIADPGVKSYFERHGAKNVYEDLEKGAGYNKKMLDAGDVLSRAKTEGERREAQKVLDFVSQEHHQTYSLKDYDVLRKDSILKDPQKEIVLRAMTSVNPGAVSKVMPKMSGKDFDTFKGVLQRSILPEQAVIKEDTGQKLDGKSVFVKRTKSREQLTEDELKMAIQEHAPKLSKAFERNLANRVTGFSFEPGEGGGGATGEAAPA